MLTKTHGSQHKTAYSSGTEITTKSSATKKSPVANVDFLPCNMLFSMVQCQHEAIIWQLHLCV